MKKWKCKDCGTEFELENAPSKCGCKGEKGFDELQGSQVEFTLDGSDAEKILKGISSISEDIKQQKSSQSELKERVEKYETELKKIVELQNKEPARRKGEYVIDGSDVKSYLKGKFGVLSNEELLIKSTSDPMLSEVQKWNDEIYMLSTIMKKDPRDLKHYHSFKETGSYKAMFDSTGSGGDWVPTGFSAQLIDIVNLELKVANLHPRVTIPMRNGPFTLPTVTTHLKAHRSTGISNGSDAPTKFKASDRTTGSVTFTPELLTVRVVWEGSLEEDSIIAILPMLRQNIGFALARAIENTVINGDTSLTLDNTDMHADTLNSQSPERMWDGYREYAKDVNAGSATAVTDEAGTFASTGKDLRDARVNMGKYGVKPDGLAIVTSIKGFLNDLMNLRDVQTLERFGSNAVVLKGELAKHDGIPIIVSEHERQDLNGSGVSGGASSGNTDTAMQVVFKDGFMFGDKRRITLETAKIQGTDSWELWASMRLDFQPLYPTSEPILHNIVDFN
jgi:HK97 family phage major capsid protein